MFVSKYYQQGDVLIKKVDEIPTDAEEMQPTQGRLILREGELTGHAHAIKEGAATLFDHSSGTFLKVDEPVVVTHEEHGQTTVEPGNYWIDAVNVYDHFEEEAKKVQD